MLDLLGLDYKEYVLALGRYGLDLDDSFLKKDFLENKDLSSFLKELLPDIIENSEEEFLSLQYYIDRLNLSGKVGIIDIGWRGRLQKALEEMLPELGKNMEIMGFYLGIMLDKENAFGYLYGLGRFRGKGDGAILRGVTGDVVQCGSRLGETV